MSIVSRILYSLFRGKAEAPASREETVIASYNIRFFNNDRDLGKRHWYVRAKYVLRNIGKMQPDILCMQEVHSPQFDFFKKHLVGYDSVICYRDDKENSEACPIYYNAARYTLLDSGTFWLSDTPDVMSKYEDSWHYRISTFVKLRDRNGALITVFNVHPDYRIEENRVRQLAVLADRVRRAEGNIVVTGDFNAKKGERCLEPFEELLRESKDFRGDLFGPTFNGFDDEEAKTIDFIYLPKEADLIETGMLNDKYDGIYPSDHYPIYAKVIF